MCLHICVYVCLRSHFASSLPRVFLISTSVSPHLSRGRFPLSFSLLSLAPIFVPPIFFFALLLVSRLLSLFLRRLSRDPQTILRRPVYTGVDLLNRLASGYTENTSAAFWTLRLRIMRTCLRIQRDQRNIRKAADLSNVAGKLILYNFKKKRYIPQTARVRGKDSLTSCQAICKI